MPTDVPNSIYNHSSPPPDSLYESFNSFIFSKDVRVFGKLLFRNHFYNATKHIPGDIVEVGVFKGSGVASWLKILKVFDSQTNKKVVGFDFFSKSEVTEYTSNVKCGEELKKVVDRVDGDELSQEAITDKLINAGFNSSSFLLVPGNIKISTRDFVCKNLGFRISVLYLDVDLGEPTYYALINLWDRIIPGGYIVFDEYEYHSFDESAGVEKFLKERELEYSIETTHFVCPTAFMIKKKM